jgi:hypothetical protein
MANSRSFTRSLSIVAVAVVAFAALELLAAQPAFAGIVCCTDSTKSDCLCDSSTVCNITRNGKFYGTRDGLRTCWNLSSYGSASQIKSTIECTAVNGIGTFENSESALLGITVLDATSFTQSALLSCEVKPEFVGDTNPHIDTAHFCQLDISYSRAGLAQCSNPQSSPSTLTYAAFCGQVSDKKNPLSVNGTLKCPAALNSPSDKPNWCDNDACILNLGIAEQAGHCDDLFPANSELGLAEGQVLSFSQTVEGPNCGMESQVIAVNAAQTRYCTGGTFDNASVDCTPAQNQPLLNAAAITESAVQFDVTFSPNTLNATCNPNNNDLWRFTILGNQHLDVTRIDVSSLEVEGEGAGTVTCGTAVNNNLSCEVKACPGVSAAVKAHKNSNGTADITVTGNICTALNPSCVLPTTAILGEQNVPISGQ